LRLKTTFKERLTQIGISETLYISTEVFFIDFSVNFVNIFNGVEKFDRPIYVFLHGYDASKAFREVQFRRKFQRLGLNSNVYFVSPCRYFLNKLRISFGFETNRLLHLPYGVEVRSKIVLSDYLNRDDFKLLFVGRFVEKKNPLALIEMLNYLVHSKCLVNVQLVLIGDGPLLPQVIDRVYKYKLLNHVVFKGSLPHENVLAEFQNTFLYVQHSITDFEGDQEGLPNSILEAMSYSVPVVSTIHSGITEIVKDGYNGFLVQELDYYGMAERIWELCTNDVLYQRVKKNVINTREEELWTNKQRAENLIAQIQRNV
jgi:glycosyltransferase involved in cell wall biosynthesis